MTIASSPDAQGLQRCLRTQLESLASLDNEVRQAAYLHQKTVEINGQAIENLRHQIKGFTDGIAYMHGMILQSEERLRTVMLERDKGIVNAAHLEKELKKLLEFEQMHRND